MEGLTEGRIVHFVLTDGTHRPAMIVNAWGGKQSEPWRVNLHVYLDGANDAYRHGLGFAARGAHSEQPDAYGVAPVAWETSVPYSEEPKPRTWHWIERA